jgi:predicted nucleic acid-binding Zn ribbon protein
MAFERPTRNGRRRKGGSPRPTSASSEWRGHRVGNLSLLLPSPPKPAEGLDSCLAQLQDQWRQKGHLAALWQAWPRLVGAQLAPHCRPLSMVGGVLTVGAAPGPWLQGLLYTRHQLLGSLRGAGFSVREVRVCQHHAVPSPPAAASLEADVWARHPSRIDIHGLADCPACGRPAPTGEMALWGTCGFCRRSTLSERVPAD